jgi:hypothetical protein
MVKVLLVGGKIRGHSQGFSWLEVKVKVMVKVLLVRGKSQGNGQGSPGKRQKSRS